jgi:hypothetical protein
VPRKWIELDDRYSSTTAPQQRLGYSQGRFAQCRLISHSTGRFLGESLVLSDFLLYGTGLGEGLVILWSLQKQAGSTNEGRRLTAAPRCVCKILEANCQETNVLYRGHERTIKEMKPLRGPIGLKGNKTKSEK